MIVNNFKFVDVTWKKSIILEQSCYSWYFQIMAFAGVFVCFYDNNTRNRFASNFWT